MDRRNLIRIAAFFSLFLTACGGLAGSGSGGAVQSCGPKQSNYDSDVSFLIKTSSSPNAILTGGYAGGFRQAQSFTTTTALSVTKVYLPLKAIGDPSGTVISVNLRNDVASLPTDSPDLGTGTITADLVGSDANLSTTNVRSVRFDLGSPVGLAASTTYWIVIDANSSASNTNRVAWMGQAANPYSGGRAMGYNTMITSWLDLSVVTAVDLSFLLGCD